MSDGTDTAFTTERLRARRWRPEDAEAAFAIYADPEVLRWLGDGQTRPAENVAVVEAMLATRAERERGSSLGMWALERLEDGVIVGSILLVPLENRGPEIEAGWHLARAHWGHGYATEGARGMFRYGFEQAGLRRIIALVYPENARSIAVCDRLGLTHEGTMLAYGSELELYSADQEWLARA